MSVKELRAKIAKLESENAQLSAAVNNNVLPQVVEGSFKVNAKLPSGKSLTGEYAFTDGHLAIRIPNTSQPVSTVLMLKIANGDDLKDESFVGSEALLNWDKDMASEFLTDLALKGYNYFKAK